MGEDDIKLITYEEVLKELKKSKSNHLLLGNGFNLSLGIRTDYQSILNKMQEKNKDYKKIITDSFDLEEFIGICKKQTKKEEENPYEPFMKNFYHNKIKLDFMNAVTQIVSEEIKKIKQVKSDEIYLLFKQFDNYFTLNYDPFLYQLLMSYKKENKKEALVFKETFLFIEEQMEDTTRNFLEEIEKGYQTGTLQIELGKNKTFELKKLSKSDFERSMRQYFGDRISGKDLKRVINLFWNKKNLKEENLLENIDDGFDLFDGKIVYKKPHTQNLIFLHGAFHIYQKDKSICKITQQSEKALYQKLEEIVGNADEDIICVFRDNNKEAEIMQNKYLKNGLHKLTNLEGVMVIIGSSLAENDSHIFKAINQSKVQCIFIASCEKDKVKDFQNAIKFWSGKEIVLFDRETISYAK